MSAEGSSTAELACCTGLEAIQRDDGHDAKRHAPLPAMWKTRPINPE